MISAIAGSVFDRYDIWRRVGAIGVIPFLSEWLSNHGEEKNPEGFFDGITAYSPIRYSARVLMNRSGFEGSKKSRDILMNCSDVEESLGILLPVRVLQTHPKSKNSGEIFLSPWS
jgi:hypothetical protein